MIKRLFLVLLFPVLLYGIVSSQSFVKTSDLFQRTNNNSRTGQINIVQNPAIDTLISRYILISKKTYAEHDHYGISGWRIQIYNNSSRNAKEEANKVNQEFMSKFPGSIRSYSLFAQPAYYKIRVGDFRTKAEATKLFLTISKVFPDAYIVPDIINFPDLNNK